ncbi:MAG: YbbR-like domain-containing protein [Clostridia bacterium]
MKKEILEFFTRNWIWKLIAIVCATLAWFLYINLEDPISKRAFTVKVEILNEQEAESNNDQTIEYDPSDFTVAVWVRGRRSELDDFKSSYITATADFKNIQPGKSQVNIQYSLNAGKAGTFELVDNQNVHTIEVKVESNITVNLPLEYEIEGTPAEGYVRLEDDSTVYASPDVISIYGAESKVNAVETAKVIVNIDGATASMPAKGEVLLLDKDGNTIPRDSFKLVSANLASVYVSIYKTKTISIISNITGDTPDGYVYMNDAGLSQKQVTVYGSEVDVAKIDRIVLPEVKLDTCTSNFEQEYDLEAMLEEATEGTVHLYNPESTTVKLTFTVKKKEVANLTLPRDQIEIVGLSSLYEASIPADSVNISITGLQEDLEAVEVADLKGKIDVSALLRLQSVKLEVTDCRRA